MLRLSSTQISKQFNDFARRLCGRQVLDHRWEYLKYQIVPSKLTNFVDWEYQKHLGQRTSTSNVWVLHLIPDGKHCYPDTEQRNRHTDYQTFRSPIVA